MWNKADICTVLLSNETSTAPFLRRPQNVVNVSRTSINLFAQEHTGVGGRQISKINKIKDGLDPPTTTTTFLLKKH